MSKDDAPSAVLYAYVLVCHEQLQSTVLGGLSQYMQVVTSCD